MKNLKNIFKKMNSTEKANEQNEQSTENSANEQEQDYAELNTVDEKESKINELQSKVDELNDRYLRLYSEFDNFRKRTSKERIELIQTAGEDVFKLLLPVIDDFERAIKSNAETTDIKAVNDGVQLIFNKLKLSLTQKGLEEMKAIGEPFNSDLHEAITSTPAASEDMKGKIVEELEKGYSLNGKIIRFAKVIIGN
jgi:molecular chaperone GrpE